jgi:hypothetical protein
MKKVTTMEINEIAPPGLDNFPEEILFFNFWKNKSDKIILTFTHLSKLIQIVGKNNALKGFH